MEIELTSKRIKLINTHPSEIGTITKFESTSIFIGKNTEEEHQQLISDPDILHLSVKQIENNKLIGFVILAGVQNKNRSLEFRRIYISDSGFGYGKETIKLVKKICFEKLKFHRLWLDVNCDNARAIQLYKSEQFNKEGTFRDAILTNSGFKNMDIYSLLEDDYVD